MADWVGDCFAGSTGTILQGKEALLTEMSDLDDTVISSMLGYERLGYRAIEGTGIKLDKWSEPRFFPAIGKNQPPVVVSNQFNSDIDFAQAGCPLQQVTLKGILQGGLVKGIRPFDGAALAVDIQSDLAAGQGCYIKR